LNVRSIAIRLLIQSHRWVGIVLGLASVIWFASGIAMMYSGGMPDVDAQERLERLPVLDVARVRITPAQAGRSAVTDLGSPVLQMVQGRPAYRFMSGAVVFADDGKALAPLDEAAAAQIAQQFLGESPPLRLVERQESADQWTLQRRGVFPLLKYAADDGIGTELYVSAKRAEVVQMSTRRERVLAWISAIPHWLYFKALRQQQALWTRSVIWIAALVCLLTLLGLVLAFTQWRRTRPLDLKRAIPYRGGMRWHYITGAVFGIFALTWAFSGLLSMEPFAWTKVPELEVPLEALSGGNVELASYDGISLVDLPLLAAPRSIKEVTFVRIHGEHYLEMHTTAPGLQKPETGEVLIDASTMVRRTLPFDAEAILAHLRQALPGMPVAEYELLRDYDDYYYSRSMARPLPVLRVKLGDKLKTWLYVDLHNSRLVANVHRYSRIERWLYNGLHSLDFRFWYSKRPLWDVAMITLLLGGLAASSLGIYYGIRRLLR
jgi:hypothetical protein